jgi:phosphate transport system protein
LYVLPRLLDLGLDRIRNIITDMARLSESSVFSALEAYESESNAKKHIFEQSEKLRTLQDEVTDLAIELIARYQPVATDLRFIKSCMEIAYGYSRFGRYSYDIVDVLETLGPLSGCNKHAVSEMAITVRKMILLSVNALESRDKTAAPDLYQMDDTVDTLYRKYLRELVSNLSKNSSDEPRCYISNLLILRYLERISDHACYVGDSVYYIITGSSSPRR